MRMTCGGIIRPASRTRGSARTHRDRERGREGPSIADSTVRITTDTEVIRTLLANETQNSRSGRVSTAVMLCRVGGQGGDAGDAEIRSPGLKVLASTR